MRQKEHEPGPGESPAIIYRFRNAKEAKRAYEAVRDAMLAEDADASVLRFTLSGVSHVAVVSEAVLPKDFQEEAMALMRTKGDPADVAPEVLGQLQRRRRTFKSTGLDYLERRSGS